MTATVTTIGYENVGQPAFIARLKAEGITLLVDVRAIANSRRAGFAKRLLTSSLAGAGITYRHTVALGTPKAGREAAKKGDIATLRAVYADTLNEPKAQLDLREIAMAAETGSVCLMCLEEDWRHCHRAMICERLAADLNVQARHLTFS